MRKYSKRRLLEVTIHEKILIGSSIFIITKSDGRIHLILNLKRLNKSVKHEHLTEYDTKHDNKTLLHGNHNHEICTLQYTHKQFIPKIVFEWFRILSNKICKLNKIPVTCWHL